MGNPYMGTFVNGEDPVEMPHNEAFHKGLHCSIKQSSKKQEMSQSHDECPQRK